MHNLLDKFSRKEATARDLILLEKLCDMVRNTSLCGLGQTAPNPVLSTLRYFRDEYLASIVDETPERVPTAPAMPAGRNGSSRKEPLTVEVAR